MDKLKLSERDICTKFITPAIENSGWQQRQIREEVSITDGLIIGSGTRLREDYQKLYFNIMDFKGATRLFADPDFDGEPVVIYEPEEGETLLEKYANNGIADIEDSKVLELPPLIRWEVKHR